ncbi:uncharacterized protein LOC129593800, partial [Paramacrobiotus metropolitanus]|uniref:uncharacterized protein LOC129593800 n=1 Tax=Paramacrobiotus metropolitanus TaxID=2943436 RepID=UPI002445BB58
TMSVTPDKPMVLQSSDVVIVQLPFEFENLFQQPVLPSTSTKKPETAAEAAQALGLVPRYRRRQKARKSLMQHIDEIDSPLLRISECGREIYCIPCEMNLTEFGKVKKSSVKLHLKCKRHLFNLKQQEKKLRHSLPPEIKRDDVLGLYKCTLCGKAISSDPHDVRRHCAGKRHQRLLVSEGDDVEETEDEIVPNTIEEVMQIEEGEPEMIPTKQMCARAYNNEFVYDVLDFVMKSNCQLGVIKNLKKLLNKWTTMKLPTLDTIRRNHLPRYLSLNPDIAQKREEAALRRAAKQRQKESAELAALEAEMIDDGTDKFIQGESFHLGVPVGSVTTLDIEQAIKALGAGQEGFSISDLVQSVAEDPIMSD